MPYAHEHAARLRDPAEFDEFRRTNNAGGEGVHFIYGLKDGKADLQAVRFSVAEFTADEARKWLSDHDMKPLLFEEAVPGEDDAERVALHDRAPLGCWMIDQRHLSSLHAGQVTGVTRAALDAEDEYPCRDGIAVISLEGVLTKGDWCGTSTLRARRQVRAAAADPSVSAIVLAIDSPGGHVAGTKELADEVRAAGRSKLTVACIEDLGASAAYWVAAQCQRVVANATAEVGSIGTVAAVADLSKQAEKEGITVHVVSTGAHKGSFTPGAPVTEEMLADLRERVTALNGHFLAAVSAGRKMPADKLAEIADGRVFLAAKAMELGLIDGIATIDQVAAQIRAEQQARDGQRRAHRLTAQLTSARLAEAQSRFTASCLPEAGKASHNTVSGV